VRHATHRVTIGAKCVRRAHQGSSLQHTMLWKPDAAQDRACCIVGLQYNGLMNILGFILIPIEMWILFISRAETRARVKTEE
jgi:hypothetical protein